MGSRTRKRIIGTAATLLAVAWAGTACGSDSDGGDAGGTLTATELCAVLTDADLAPLREEAVDSEPEPDESAVIRECRWPVAPGWGFLTIKVFEPAAGTELFTGGAERTIEVGAATGYVTSKSDWSSCSMSVIGPRTPDGFLLAVDYDMPYGMAETDPDHCKKVVPQREKVLEALGWA